MNLRRREAFTGVALIFPALAGVLVFFLVPFAASVVMTFVDAYDSSFVGFAAYSDLFASEAFRIASLNTAKFILVGVPLIMLVSTALALMLHSKARSMTLYRTALLFPLIVPIASVIMVFTLFFSQDGAVNAVLSVFGVPATDWVESSGAFGMLVFLYVWKNCGYNVVLLLAGLSSIPDDIYEAARTDGASSPAQFFRITLPLMFPTFFFVLVFSIVNSFKSFREAFLIGGTHPHPSIYMLQHFINNNFGTLSYQRLSAAATLLFIAVCALIFVMFRFKERSEV